MNTNIDMSTGTGTSTLDPLLNDIEDFYDAARKLRQHIRSADTDIQNSAVIRMRIIPGWRSLSDEDIASTPIPLKLGKMVVALEHGFASWGELRVKVGEEQMKRMQENNGDAPHEHDGESNRESSGE